MTMTVHEKDPAARALYGFDWAPLLSGGDTIVTSTWSSTPAGLTLEDPSHDDTTASIFVLGGAVGERYCLVNRVESSLGRIDERTKVVIVRNR